MLICDDNADAANTTAAWFRLVANAEIKVCYDGLACLDAGQGWQPDVALLDIGMPSLNGYELARRLASLDRRPFLVAITGWGAMSDKKRAAEAGFDLHITKPVKLEALLDEIRDALSRRTS
jgi:CheY-like chemotaxis protein